MAKRILNYFISSLAFCLLAIIPTHAQDGRHYASPNQRRQANQKDKKKKVPEIVYPLYNGVNVGVDLFGIGNKVLGGDFLSSEVSVDVNLKNRIFPVVEMGYGKTDSWNDYGTHYKSSAPYFRIGMDYNVLFKKNFKNYLFVGLRYATTSFKYDIEALDINDPVYGGKINNPNQEDNIFGGSVPFNHKGMKGSMQWFELCGGIRAHIWKDLYMGWTVRFKYRTSSTMDNYGNPWYIPGYGKYSSNTIGLTYTVIYKLPL